MNPLPALRSDIQVLAQASPGKPDRCLLKDPTRGLILEIGSRERFLCERPDGTNSRDTIAAAFRTEFGIDLSPAGFESLLEMLKREGLLVDSAGAVELREWERMKPLPINTPRWLSVIASLFSPLAGWPGYLLMAVLLFTAFGMLSIVWPLVWDFIWNFFHYIDAAGAAGFSAIFSVQTVLQIVFFFLTIPFLRELAKGAACVHYGIRVHEIRLGWFMRFIPRCVAGIHGMVRLEKSQQVRVLSTGLLVELAAFCLGMTGMGVFQPGNPMQGFCTNLAIGAALRFLLTANPLGELDGGALLGLWLDELDLHHRATRMFRAWLFRKPMPEPVGDRQRRRLIAWGAASDLVAHGLTIAILVLVGFLLIAWMDGVGAVVLLVLIGLKYERNIRSFLARCRTGSAMATSSKSGSKSFWIKLLIFIVIVVLLCVIPYPYEVSGEFRVQPIARRELRSEVSALIEKITKSEGDTVKAGEVIAQLSTRLIQRDLDIARSNLKKGQEDLKAMEAGARPEDIAKYEQAVKTAETKLKYSEDTLVRTKDLHAKGHVADQDYQNVLLVRDMDRENLALANTALTSLKAGVRKEEIEAQRAVVESLAISVRNLEEDLKRTTLVSPIDGRVVTMYIQGHVGQQSAPGDVVAVIEDTSRATVRISLPEPYVGLVSTGSAVRIRPWAHADRIFDGKITMVMPVVMDKSEDVMKEDSVQQEHGTVRSLNSPAERIVPVLAEIDNADGLFKSDMTGYAKIAAGTRSVGYAFFHPVIRFFKVQVWSWLP
jgi:multidrug efflux pump subunit AcrA (membrane-fusion protein)